MKPLIYKYRIRVVALALVALLTLIANAQEVTGSLLGTVRDSSGAAVAGAKVTITDAEKKTVVRVVNANGGGEFSAPLLRAGVYDIEVEAAGFKKRIERGVKLDLNQRRSVDVSLEVGAVTEVVTVESDQLQVETQSIVAGTLISGTQVRELALNSRHFGQLVTLVPGVSTNLPDQLYVGTTRPNGT